MRFNITFKKGLEVVAAIKGVVEIDKKLLTLGDLEKALEIEQHLEKLTGLRVHIESEG